MKPSRRDFLQLSASAALAGQASATGAATPVVVARMGGDLLSRMSWLNPPVSESYSEGTLNCRSKGKTDFWRKTYYGYINDNGHFFSLPATGDFTFQARIEGNYSQRYDQAGLMIRIDEKHWMKCGSELVDGKRMASVVVTHDFSDWSTMEDLAQVGTVWWRVVRARDSIEAQCSRDGDKFQTVRQGYFPAGIAVAVGVMCASPEGAGFDCVFDQLSIAPNI